MRAAMPRAAAAAPATFMELAAPVKWAGLVVEAPAPVPEAIPWVLVAMVPLL